MDPNRRENQKPMTTEDRKNLRSRRRRLLIFGFLMMVAEEAGISEDRIASDTREETERVNFFR